jgi:hypothetical protein
VAKKTAKSIDEEMKKFTQGFAYKALDPVDHPPHYTQGTVECIDAIESMIEGTTLSPLASWLRCSAFKYLWRLDRKGKALEDAKKARWYLERLIKKLEADAVAENP